MSEAPYITKGEIVAAIKAARPNLSGRQVWRAVDTIIDQMIVALANDTYQSTDGEVYIGGLGIFRARPAIEAAREIPDVNHQGQVVQLPVHVRYGRWFAPCKELAEVINDV